MVNRRVVLESGVATLALAGVDPRRSLRAQEPASETTVETGPQSVPQIEVLPANPQPTAPADGVERSNMLASAAFLLLMGIVTQIGRAHV